VGADWLLNRKHGQHQQRHDPAADHRRPVRRDTITELELGPKRPQKRKAQLALGVSPGLTQVLELGAL
jgi:hypothetical protein